MTSYSVDLTGVQEGDTIAVAGLDPISFVVGPALVQSITINYPGQTAADLPEEPADGSRAVFRVGTYPDQHQEVLRYRVIASGLGAPGRWIGEVEYLLMTQSDSWAMDLGNRSQAQMEDWSIVDNAVPYGKAFAILDGSLNLSHSSFSNGTGVITVDDTTSPHSFPFADTGVAGVYFQCRDNYIRGEVGSSTTLTNCTRVQGSGGTIPDQEFVTQGYPGGYGVQGTTLDFADQLFAAGLTPQERLVSLCNSAPDEKKIVLAPYWYEYDEGDGTSPPTIPLSGGLGVSATLTSLDDTGGVQAQERDFFMTSNSYTDVPFTATKKFLTAKLAGKMEAGAFTSGSVLDTKLTVRWVV